MKDKKSWFVLFAVFAINGILTMIVLSPAADELALVDEFLTPMVFASAVFSAFALEYIRKFNNKMFYGVLCLIVLSVAAKFLLERAEIDQRQNIYAQKIAEDSLKSLPEKAFIIGESDYSIFPLWYVQNIRKLRKDILVMDADFFMLPWFQDQTVRKLPVIKELIPDITSHGRSRNAGRIDFAALEDFKLIQAEKLSDNIRNKLHADVFYTYDFAEMARAFAPESFRKLKAYGPLYRYDPEDKAPSHAPASDLSAFRHSLYLPPEERVFLLPYLPEMRREADRLYAAMDFSGTESLLDNIYRLEPSPVNAVNLALILAEQNHDLGRAESLIDAAIKNTPLMEPRFILAQGLMQMRRKNYAEALRILIPLEAQVPNLCQAKLYIYETQLRSGDAASAAFYRQKIKAQCPEYYDRRAGSVTGR